MARKTPKLNKKEREHFRKLLLEVRSRVVSGLEHFEQDALNKSQREASGDLSGYSHHMADMASDSYTSELRMGMAENEQHLLNEIDHALRKMDEGTFGLCERYGTPISRARLQAVPYTRYSLKAQEEIERETPPGRR